jgi:MFS family permease
VSEPDSPQAAWRLAAALAITALAASGMYVVPVVLPAVQAEFGVARADASLPYSALMIGFALGGVAMGRLSDRFGIMVPLILGGACMGAGFILAGSARDMATFTLAHGLLIGFLGCSAGFAPLLADTSLWWVRRRGIAVAIAASGNYLGGVIAPPIVQRFTQSHGWRETYFGMGLACGIAMMLLALAMRAKPPLQAPPSPVRGTARSDEHPFGLPANTALALLMIAGVACCVAMSMPQVHIVAYCGDLGYGVARGAEMLAVMMGFGIVSRLVSGYVCDRIGGLKTLLLGSVLQGLALLLFLPFTGLVSLYVISALFGLFQGGIVPSYAIIIREHFGARRAGGRVGLVIMCTLLGMALGGWMSGKAFDLTGSYRAAFLNGIAWNAVNVTIVTMLLWRLRRPVAA